jgi:hypothetical protein
MASVWFAILCDALVLVPVALAGLPILPAFILLIAVARRYKETEDVAINVQ